MLGWLLDRVLSGKSPMQPADEPQTPDYVISIACIDDITQEELINAIADALRRNPALIRPATFQVGDDIQVTIHYGANLVANTDMPEQATRHYAAYLYVGRMRARGYQEDKHSIRIDLPMTKHDINTRYKSCIDQIKHNVRLIATQMYCMTGKDPSQFYGCS